MQMGVWDFKLNRRIIDENKLRYFFMNESRIFKVKALDEGLLQEKFGCMLG